VDLKKIIPLGGAGEIGAAGYALVFSDGEEDKCVLLDCGLHPDPRAGFTHLVPDFYLLDGIAEPDAVIISHCHHDHVGALPIFKRKYPNAKIFMTEESSIVYPFVFEDSKKLIEAQRIDSRYLIDVEDVKDAPSVTSVKFGKDFEIIKGVKGRFYRAGHIFGAGAIFIYPENHNRDWNLLFTGDIKLEDQFFIKKCKIPENLKPKILICETTEAGEKKILRYETAVERIKNTINKIATKKGNVLIPVTALGKTQEILCLLDNLRRKKEIPNIPIYCGGLGYYITLAMLTKRYISFKFQHFDDKSKNVRPAVWVVTSGMFKQNTLSWNLMEKIYRDKKSAVIIVSYQPEGGAGRKILRGKFQGKKVQCKVVKARMPSHSTGSALAEWIKKMSPDTVIYVHGSKEGGETIQKETEKFSPLVAKRGVEILITKKNGKFVATDTKNFSAVIFSVGTSLLTHYKRKYEKADKKIEIKDIEEEALLEFLRTAPKEYSAEINTYTKMKKYLHSKARRLFLLATATTPGKLCGGVLKRYFKENREDVEIFYIKGFDKYANVRKKGIKTFVSKILSIIEMYPDAHLLATGGFKIQTSYMTLLGMLYKKPTYYTYESKKSELIKLPYIPLDFPKEIIAENKNTIIKILKSDVISAQKIMKKLPGGFDLLFNVDSRRNRMELSALGIALLRMLK